MKTFQSTRPSRASTADANIADGLLEFQSTRPSRASTLTDICKRNGKKISIHKALTGLDKEQRGPYPEPTISIHKALTGLDVKRLVCDVDFPQFQSTRPSRASTERYCSLRPEIGHFNPQGPHGPRRIVRREGKYLAYFNPQGPHGPRPELHTAYDRMNYFNPQGPHGPRQCGARQRSRKRKFQSTRPSRASTHDGG